MVKLARKLSTVDHMAKCWLGAGHAHAVCRDKYNNYKLPMIETLHIRSRESSVYRAMLIGTFKKHPFTVRNKDRI